MSDDERSLHKAQVEALLFAAEEPRTVRWMANFLKLGGRYVRKLLDQLRREYRDRPGALEIREVYKDTAVPEDLDAAPWEDAAAPRAPDPEELDADDVADDDLDEQDRDLAAAEEGAAASASRPKSIPAYHIAVRTQHQHLVQKLLPPELGKPVLGTLSLIAIRQPILQSEIIHSRGKRAYAHIKDLLVHRLIHRKPVDGTYALSTTAEFARRYQVDAAAMKRVRKLSKRGAPPPDAGDAEDEQEHQAEADAGLSSAPPTERAEAMGEVSAG